MIKTIITGLLFLVSIVGLPQSINVPPGPDGNDFFVRIEKQQLKDLDSLYAAETDLGHNFIIGRDYVQYYLRSEHSPILYPEKERTASLTYSGRVYNNLVLQYDTFLDQIIYGIKSTTSNDIVRRLALNSDNISMFVLYFDHDTLTFRHVSQREDTGSEPDPGFYEVVYDGRCKYLLKHKSTHYMLNAVDEYSYEPEGYVMVDGGFVRIASQKQFVSLFGNRSKEIRQYIKEKNIKISRAGKSQIAGILKFYENNSNLVLAK